MGRTLTELCKTMSAREFALHLQLEIERNRGAEAPVDPQLAADFGM